MRFPLVAVLLGSLFGACATGERAPEPSSQRPIALTVSGQDGAAKVATIDGNTRSLDLRVVVEKGSTRTLKQPVEVSPKFVAPGMARLEARLTGIPVELATRQIDKSLWEIEIPENLIKLLSKESRNVTYSGQLILDTAGKSIPLSVTLVPSLQAPAASGKSAG